MRELGQIEIEQALGHKDLLAHCVRGGGSSWTPWRAFLKSVYGRPLDAAELAIYQRCTGRQEPLTAPLQTCSMIIGRRAGKSAAAAALAVFESAFRGWGHDLGVGEKAVTLIVAVTKEQAGVVFNYVRGIITASPLLRQMIERETVDTIELSNGCCIQTVPTNFRSMRGRAIATAILDEAAFYRDQDGVTNDREILTAVRAGQAQFGASAKLIMLSSPYRRSGVLFDHWKRYHGVDDPRHLAWMGATTTMNPSIDPTFIAEQFEIDPLSAASEFGDEETGIQFRSDVSGYIERDVVESLVIDGRFDLPPLPRVRYHAFVDAAGGGGPDSMTMAISHEEDGVAVLDVVREMRPRFDPHAVVIEFAGLLREYRVREIHGDRYAGTWCSTAFEKQRIEYRPSPFTKSQIYVNALPALMARKVELLDNKRLTTQLIALERRTGRGRGDTIDHAPGGHDDVVNAALGAITCMSLARHAPANPITTFSWT